MKLSDFRTGTTTLSRSICNACYTLRSASEITVLWVGMVREDEIDLPIHFCSDSVICKRKILVKATNMYEDRARRNALRRMGAF